MKERPHWLSFLLIVTVMFYLCNPSNIPSLLKQGELKSLSMVVTSYPFISFQEISISYLNGKSKLDMLFVYSLD